jgi:glutathione S-transferase
MKLYYLPGACSLASDISLREAGVPFTPVKVSRRDKRTSDGQNFTQVSSKGYVPALQLDDGRVLTENVAVLTYIAGLQPQKKLGPTPASPEFYQLLEWLAFVSSELHKNFGTVFGSSEPQVQQYARGNIAKRLDWLDGALAGKTFLLGESFTVADAYLFTVLSWAPHMGVDLDPYPSVKAYYARVSSRPAVVEAMKAEGLIN